ncbi:hypothetical protein NUU61_007855 [Penicillium alfredii]|uniref:Uncharacterized protein n=1 Tax=Penicillium alfredii TaxID=1506179 RepID=A0A9W9JYQ5_9EURO|nr:uncharacterized protein NUU61_007855 [Penicillium alfredii]KAJ5086548.1 hypothetical protein NUU61_007855 [Penicillium alfredii]
MATVIQLIHIHYRGKYLSLLDSDDTTPIYTVKVCREAPQMEVIRLNRDNNHSDNGDTALLSTASFKTLSMEVTLSIHDHMVMLRRPNIFSRTYGFESVALPGNTLLWEADGSLSGDFKLVNRSNHQVLSRFRNKVFSTTEVGSFEMVGDLSAELKDEIVVSGLAVLVMVQSLSLAGMVLVGSP